MRTRYFNSSIITASIFAHLPFESTLPIAYVASLIDKQTDGNGRWLEPLALDLVRDAFLHSLGEHV